MQLIGLARLGRDVETRTTPGGEVVANLALAFNYGQKDPQTGERKTQWVDASLWGNRATALAPYLRKGGLVMVHVRDPHIETYQGQNGTGYKLAGVVAEIELAGSRQDNQQQAAPAPGKQPQRQAPARTAAAAPAQSAPPQQRASGGFDTPDDDIPF